MSNNKKHYNAYNLEAKFKNYLLDNEYSRTSANNYSTDIRSFLNWFSHMLRSQHLEFDLVHFTGKTVNRYVDHLKITKKPIQNINRALSSIRTFAKFLINEEYIYENPLESVSNVKQTPLESVTFWIKTHIKPIIAFALGFIVVSVLFILPGVVASTIDRLSTQKDELLNDVGAINTTFSDRPIASTSADLMTIPIIDESGNLNLTAPYPKIIGYTGILTIQAPELTLAAQDKGNIKLQTKEGSIHFLFDGEKPNLPFESAFYFSGENLNSGALIYGQVDRESDGISLIELSSGSPTRAKFRVDSEGNVYIKGDIVLEGNLIVNPESTIFGTYSTQTATSSASN